MSVASALVLAGTVGACNTTSKSSSNQYGVTASPRVVSYGQPVPEGGGYYKVGRPYKVAGRWYKPKEDVGYDEVGLASWYGSDFHGRRTANGEVFDMGDLSAAHPTLPLPTYARVTNLSNGRSVVVRVNDRGPFAHNRLIDVSKRTADVLDFRHDGTTKVRVQYVGIAPLEGNDGQWLTTTVRNNGEPVGPVMMAGLERPQLAAPAANQPSNSLNDQQAALQPPPAPPPGTPAPPGAATVYPQQAVAYSSAPAAGSTVPAYSGAATPTTVPVQAAYTGSPEGPTPKVPVGTGNTGTGNVVYRWVQGYTQDDDNELVAQAFSAFDSRSASLSLVVRPVTVTQAEKSYR